MVDKNPNLAIIISATLLNIRFGKEPGTGALSHSIVNQTEYFGFKAIRLITSLLFNGVATTNSNRCSNWADGFLLIKNRQAGPSADTLKPALTTNERDAFTMANGNIPLSIDSHKPESFNLELSADIDEARYNIELFKDRILEDGQALLFWQNRLKTLENQVPQIQNHLIGQLKNVLANLE